MSLVFEPVRARSLPTSIWPLAALAGLALTGPFLAPLDPNAQDLMRVMEAPSITHLLGTDHVGRDILSRVFAGAPHSLGLAVLCVTLASSVGVALGLIAANGGAFVRALIMRLADLMLAFPGLLLALLFAGFLGGGIWPLLIGLNLALWPQYARMAEAVATSVLREGHVEAARLAGFAERTILKRHVLPPVLRAVMPLATLGVGQAIMSISALGFLGLGLKPPTPEWGAMINELLPFLAEGFVQMAAPCAMIFVSVLTLTLAGRALAADPTGGGHD
ncbi:MAG: ABC transporter permease subunit [Methylocystis sp.]|nr:ABC transporter permease subunit [Methylocystis sp.]MCA3587480.1 ABC transporter permease subunit [Methylocystis sp.]MCA3591029.1 ABC transporter permease subunit [Methylocystis sp.]